VRDQCFKVGEVGRGVIGADTAFIVAKDHIHHPMRLFSLHQPQLLRTMGAERIRQRHYDVD